MELSLVKRRYYRVKHAQTLEEIARTFSLPPRLLAAENALSEEPFEGQLLWIPERRGDLYTVQGGESKALLCGSEKAFEEKNKTALFYIGQTILL